MALFGQQQPSAMDTGTGPLPQGLFAGLVGSSMEVPGFYIVGDQADSGLRPLTGSMPAIPTPEQSGVQAAAGDDTSAPNAVTPDRLNRVVLDAVANVGYSTSAKDKDIRPTAVYYTVDVREGQRTGYAMTLKMTLEYSSSFSQEGMVVHLKKRQQMINDEALSELILIETAFEDWADGRWVPISTEVRYAEEAEAVVQAVITSDSGQTAGRVSTDGGVEDAKLGPVGERGRIVLTYYCEELYSYGEMVMPGQTQAPRSLVPVALQMPWTVFDCPANQCQFHATVTAPKGSRTLDASANILAYRDLGAHLKGGSNTGGEQCDVLIPQWQRETAEGPCWELSRRCLPPAPTMYLVWLAIPDEDSDWEQVGNALPPVNRLTLMQPTDEDAKLLRAGLPGGQAGELYRCKVETAAVERDCRITRVHTDFTISDASGSTCMRRSTSATTRERFNQVEERRLLMRLQSIPQLRNAGLLQPQDIWRNVILIFDSTVREQFAIESKVSDLDAPTVELMLKALAPGPGADHQVTAALGASGKMGIYQQWREAIDKLRGIRPGGVTSFVEAANTATNVCKDGERRDRDLANVSRTAYVNFDTDGGNNCGPCYEAFRTLMSTTEVVQGNVFGVGSWVDQDCASKVAKIMKGSTYLALDFPEDQSAEVWFRQDLSKWIKTLRTCPVTLKVSAGAVTWNARQGDRNENAVDCLFVTGDGCKFDQPDVSDLAFTRAVVQGLSAGESATLYLLSRLPLAQLRERLTVELIGVPPSSSAAPLSVTPLASPPAPTLTVTASSRMQVSLGAEVMTGLALGYHWMALLGGEQGKNTVENKSALCTRLRQRLEDDLSFAWNLPTKSGSTAAVGRAKTQQRPPVPTTQQPEEPELPKLRTTGPSKRCRFGGNPQMQALSASKVMPAGGGGLFGSAAAMPAGMPMAPSSSPPSAPQMMASKGKGKGAPPKGKGGGKVGPPSAPAVFGSAFGSSSWGNDIEPEKTASGAWTPAKLLESSQLVNFGPRLPMPAQGHLFDTTIKQEYARAVAALRHQAAPPPSLPNAGTNVAAEDPMVAQLLGAAPPAQTAQRTVHLGIVCDGCSQNPLLGWRFKASSHADVDICLSCRKAGNLAGQKSYVMLTDNEMRFRLALRAILDWWPLIWRNPALAATFQQAACQNLAALNLQALQQTVLGLPAL
eukprot:TRINITY_DN3298_c0_g1_i1.p1 TRINITY_DN3298_c0_g1~~TRINITY_DN3298_c0_g1_i1.p1  ORF type:complete len:1175 (+),score=198.40 TRINITY_DN3298_c0_g1_i1:101-3625(+)